ncbi:lysophosphatidylcholine acyltransferase 2 isoform X2 [Cryptotermes secundus]|uniref:lysophosphatidylcholine acyltransferase 2 isoform X2 n=1 Tax=Cryptotermes secundus TaxID=105785 RepID=UPI000CD7DB8D|nr:lysophosphatidylcholine acyltransferase 2 isoform X2 [Cryptotermes secundus]
MNGKVHTAEELPVPPDLINPFVHHLELSTTYDKIKTAVFTVIVLPVRVLAILLLLMMAWILACVGLMGLSEKELRQRPITGWRRKLNPMICALGKSTYQVGGMKLIVKGRQASRKEAPILVVAPHSTFLDAGITYVTGFPSIIVRRESGLNPFIGKLINYTQPVYVWREDPNSRQNTIKEIIDRATSDQDWPQVLIFPEGTCTNRSCLITFKPGAFYPGVPIQPVCIRYPNKLDTVTWTWEGPGALKLLWLTLTQVHSSCEIEFLPVYTPNDEEKHDPKLYANNVRHLMAKTLGIPVSDYTYDDCRLMTKAKRMNLPFASGLVEVQKLRQKLGLTQTNIEEKILIQSPHIITNEGGQISYKEFARRLEVPSTSEVLQQLFRMYDKDCTGIIDFREYLLGVLVISKASNAGEMVELAFKIFDRGGEGKVTQADTSKALYHTLAVPSEEAQRVFRQIDTTGRGYITFDEFRQYSKWKSEYSHIFLRHGEEEEKKAAPKLHVCDYNNANYKTKAE